MKTYRLTRPFDDGTAVHPRGAILKLEKAPSSAQEISAAQIAAEQAALTDAQDAVKSAERAALKAELLAEIKAELSGEAKPTNAELAAAEVEAANKAAAAAVTGGVDNNGEPLKDVTPGKAPVQKAVAK